MKKNLLGLIGSACGLATSLVYGATFIKYESESVKICDYMLGMGNGDYSGLFSILSISVIATLGVFFCSLYSLVQSIDGIKNDKDNSLKILAGSAITIFSVIYYLLVISKLNKSSAKFELGIGAILFIALSIAFFVLSLLGMLIGSKKNVPAESDKFDEIYKYKKLMDDGIITKEEFETYKTQILEKQ